MGMSVKTLGIIGIIAGMLGIPFGLLSTPAGYLLAAGGILMGVAGLLRHSEEQTSDVSWTGDEDEAPVITYLALGVGVIALLATIFSSVSGWSLSTLLSGG
jgi:tetrahydromethanopterin S-methyltransferase subunit C